MKHQHKRIHSFWVLFIGSLCLQAGCVDTKKEGTRALDHKAMTKLEAARVGVHDSSIAPSPVTPDPKSQAQTKVVDGDVDAAQLVKPKSANPSAENPDMPTVKALSDTKKPADHSISKLLGSNKQGTGKTSGASSTTWDGPSQPADEVSLEDYLEGRGDLSYGESCQYREGKDGKL